MLNLICSVNHVDDFVLIFIVVSILFLLIVYFLSIFESYFYLSTISRWFYRLCINLRWFGTFFALLNGVNLISHRLRFHFLTKWIHSFDLLLSFNMLQLRSKILHPLLKFRIVDIFSFCLLSILLYNVCINVMIATG